MGNLYYLYLLGTVLYAIFQFGSTNTFKFTCDQLQTWGVSHYACADGIECVLGYYECDSIIDCEDGSDENHCTTDWEVQCIVDYAGKKTRDGNNLEKFQCRDGMCILGCKQCDGQFDCLDRSDEEDCNPNMVRPSCN